MTTETVSIADRIEAAYERLEKAKEIVANGGVHPMIGQPDHFAVEASDGGVYTVNAACTCPDYEHRQHLNGRLCKHRLAVYLHLEAAEGADKSESKEELGW